MENKTNEPESEASQKRGKKRKIVDADNEPVQESTTTGVRHIYLVRHGQYNTEGKNDKEQVLTELGRKQAELTGQRLAKLNIKWDMIVRSTMTRAQETADIIAKYLPDNVEMKDCDMLREGTPIPPDPPAGRDPKHYIQDTERIKAAYKQYCYEPPPEQTDETNTVLVCHANIIRFFICKSIHVSVKAWVRISIDHGSITWMSVKPNGRDMLHCLSETGHMDPEFISRRNK